MENQGDQNTGGFQPQTNTNQGAGFQSQPGFQNMHGGMQIPNATAALVLGILSIPTCFCWFFCGVLSITLGIIAIVLGNKAVAAYHMNPGMYSTSSLSNAKAGKICGIIGLIMGGLALIITIIYWISVATALGASTYGLEEILKNL